ncbi:MAG: hypothetical protein JST18_11710 [Bacteroidetes bacterium]|nr:hypothetical protein [Bacteroidota bacterium]
MKRYYGLSVILMFCLSCAKPMIQIFEASSSNTKLVENSWVFENDTVRIEYNFWENYGKMQFTVYNKLEKPFYIDWKNSSFIYNGVKLDYWIDEQKTTQSSTATYYKGIVFQGSASNSIKPEKVTFIPPQSTYSNHPKFHLEKELYPRLRTQENFWKIEDFAPLKKPDTVFQKTFNYSSSPLKFRNYLSISFSENGGAYFFVDNEFYLQSVKEMNMETSKGIPIGFNDHVPVYGKSPYENGHSFYITFKR